MGPVAQVPKASRLQHAQHILGGHQHTCRRFVEVAKQRVTYPQRQPNSCLQNFREACVESRGECKTFAQAVASRRPTQRALGRQVYRIRTNGIQPASQGFERPDGQVNTSVPRAGPRLKQAGVNHLHLVAQRLHLTHQFHQRGHHTIDLGLPGIRYQCQLHAATSCALCTSTVLVCSAFQ